jgi:hypothetical protein
VVPATLHTYQRDLETVEVVEELRRISVLSCPDIQCNLDLSQCLSGTADTELWMLPIFHCTHENHIRTQDLHYYSYYTAVCFGFITKVIITVVKPQCWQSGISPQIKSYLIKCDAICLGCVMCRYAHDVSLWWFINFFLIFSTVSAYLSFTIGVHMKLTFAHIIKKYSLVSINTGSPIQLNISSTNVRYI